MRSVTQTRLISVVSDSDITTLSPLNFTIPPILLGVSVRIYNKLVISENRHNRGLNKVCYYT